MKKYYTILVFVLLCRFGYSQDLQYKEVKDVVYTSKADAYSKERCRLDYYYPVNKKDFITVIWFHGGGLTSGDKWIPGYLKDKGFAVVAASYRFAPKVTVEQIIQDAADVVEWTAAELRKNGGDPGKIIVSGHSAGGYLAMMLGLNPRYLSGKTVKSNDLLAVIPFSGQAITHFTERQRRGLEDTRPVVDSMAPLYWVRKDAAPMTLITGDRELEMLGRYEENAYLLRMLKLVGHTRNKLIELEGYGHDMVYPALPLLVEEVKKLSK